MERGKKALEDAMQQFSVIVQKLKNADDLDQFRNFVFQVLQVEVEDEEEDDHHDCSGHDHDHHHHKKPKVSDDDDKEEGEEFITWVIDGNKSRNRNISSGRIKKRSSC
jgi:ABC-type Zn2+ transport system substrate-binding protein/surface adhesin